MSICPICDHTMCDHTPEERKQSPEETYRNLTKEEEEQYRNRKAAEAKAKKTAEAAAKKATYAVSINGNRRLPFMGELEELFRLSPDPRRCRRTIY